MRKVSFVSLSFTSCVTCLVAYGCARSAPKAEAPPGTAPVAESKPAAPTPAPVASSSSADTQLGEHVPDAVITRSVSDRVLAPRIAYMVNYPVSGAKDVAD